MKYYLIIILFFIFLIVAVGVYYFFLQRHRMYKDLKSICNSLSTNISFKKISIDEILTSNYSKVGILTKLIIKNHTAIDKVERKEKGSIIKEFFSSLGKGDIKYELDNIKYYEKEFESMELEAKEDLQKKGSVCFKLIIGIALIICIILV